MQPNANSTKREVQTFDGHNVLNPNSFHALTNCVPWTMLDELAAEKHNLAMEKAFEHVKQDCII